MSEEEPRAKDEGKRECLRVGKSDSCRAPTKKLVRERKRWKGEKVS